MSIAEAAIKEGHQVTHFSCTFRHSTKVQRFNENKSIDINEFYKLVFIYANPYLKNVSAKRIFSHREFTTNLLKQINNFEKPDVILVAYPPITPALELSKWANKNNIPIFIDIIDPWPDVFLRLVPQKAKWALKITLYPMYIQWKSILKNCSGVVAISSEYIDWAKSFNIPIKKTASFLPSVPFDEVQKKIEQYKIYSETYTLKIVYAGNLGVAYDIPTILKAAEELEKTFPGETHFTIAGAGIYENLIHDYISKYNNLTFLGRIGNEDLMKLYANSDLGLAQYSAGATQSITYKFFDYLSAGLPILNSLQSEMAVLIVKHELGLNNKAGDYKKLIENIKYFLSDRKLLNIYKENSNEYARLNGDNKTTYSNFIKFINS
jgi:glycosyltransferase involved in cell wall biosynthesis